MRVFDLHCDTITECSNEGINLRKNNLHLDLERASALGDYTQVFAVWIPDDIRGQNALDYFEKTADCFYRELKSNSDLLSLRSEGLNTPVKAILGLEGGSGAGGTLEGLHRVYERGVRVITLAWKNHNEIAGGAFSEGGFTDYGKAFVKEAEALGIIIDASHLNRESFFELSSFASKPFIATHSNADIVDNPKGRARNLTKEQIEVIRDMGGIIGLNYYVDFIETDEIKGIDALARQLEYFFSLGCENLLALGSDYDGCKISPELCGVEKLPSVYNGLISRGFDDAFLQKLFYDNANEFLQSIDV